MDDDGGELGSKPIEHQIPESSKQNPDAETNLSLAIIEPSIDVREKGSNKEKIEPEITSNGKGETDEDSNNIVTDKQTSITSRHSESITPTLDSLLTTIHGGQQIIKGNSGQASSPGPQIYTSHESTVNNNNQSVLSSSRARSPSPVDNSPLEPKKTKKSMSQTKTIREKFCGLVNPGPSFSLSKPPKQQKKRGHQSQNTLVWTEQGQNTPNIDQSRDSLHELQGSHAPTIKENKQINTSLKSKEKPGNTGYFIDEQRTKLKKCLDQDDQSKLPNNTHGRAFHSSEKSKSYDELSASFMSQLSCTRSDDNQLLSLRSLDDGIIGNLASINTPWYTTKIGERSAGPGTHHSMSDTKDTGPYCDGSENLTHAKTPLAGFCDIANDNIFTSRSINVDSPPGYVDREQSILSANSECKDLANNGDNPFIHRSKRDNKPKEPTGQVHKGPHRTDFSVDSLSCLMSDFWITEDSEGTMSSDLPLKDRHPQSQHRNSLSDNVVDQTNVSVRLPRNFVTGLSLTDVREGSTSRSFDTNKKCILDFSNVYAKNNVRDSNLSDLAEIVIPCNWKKDESFGKIGRLHSYNRVDKRTNFNSTKRLSRRIRYDSIFDSDDYDYPDDVCGIASASRYDHVSLPPSGIPHTSFEIYDSLDNLRLEKNVNRSLSTPPGRLETPHLTSNRDPEHAHSAGVSDSRFDNSILLSNVIPAPRSHYQIADAYDGYDHLNPRPKRDSRLDTDYDHINYVSTDNSNYVRHRNGSRCQLWTHSVYCDEDQFNSKNSSVYADMSKSGTFPKTNTRRTQRMANATDHVCNTPSSEYMKCDFEDVNLTAGSGLTSYNAYSRVNKKGLVSSNPYTIVPIVNEANQEGYTYAQVRKPKSSKQAPQESSFSQVVDGMYAKVRKKNKAAISSVVDNSSQNSVNFEEAPASDFGAFSRLHVYEEIDQPNALVDMTKFVPTQPNYISNDRGNRLPRTWNDYESIDNEPASNPCLTLKIVGSGSDYETIGSDKEMNADSPDDQSTIKNAGGMTSLKGSNSITFLPHAKDDYQSNSNDKSDELNSEV